MDENGCLVQPTAYHTVTVHVSVGNDNGRSPDFEVSCKVRGMFWNAIFANF
jgi:hypothetical protein